MIPQGCGGTYDGVDGLPDCGKPGCLLYHFDMVSQYKWGSPTRTIPSGAEYVISLCHRYLHRRHKTSHCDL